MFFLYESNGNINHFKELVCVHSKSSFYRNLTKKVILLVLFEHAFEFEVWNHNEGNNGFRMC